MEKELTTCCDKDNVKPLKDKEFKRVGMNRAGRYRKGIHLLEKMEKEFNLSEKEKREKFEKDDELYNLQEEIMEEMTR